MIFKNKKGGFSDLFILMIVSIIIIIVSAVFIYLGGRANTQIEQAIGGQMINGENTTLIVQNTVGVVNTTYQALYWISWFLIIGMVLSIFIGSYLVTTKPVFFIPYIFIVIIATIVAVGLSNAYETIISDATLASTFAGFVGANFIMLKLPIWIAIIGIVGGIIMFSRMGSSEAQGQGGYYVG